MERSKFELKMAIEGCKARENKVVDEKEKQYWRGKADGLLWALNEEYVPNEYHSLDSFLDEFKEGISEANAGKV